MLPFKKYDKRRLYKNNIVNWRGECTTFIIDPEEGDFVTSRKVRKNMRYYIHGCEDDMFSLSILKPRRYKNK